jgi:hypothetical protein
VRSVLWIASVQRGTTLIAMRLSGWKQIASHLRCGVRTAQRWAAERGLPVQRIGHGPKPHLVAYPELINEWVRNGGPVRLDASDSKALIAKSKKLRADSQVARRTLRDGVHLLHDNLSAFRDRQIDFRKMRERCKSSGKS